jgi:hypothetical protein
VREAPLDSDAVVALEKIVAAHTEAAARGEEGPLGIVDAANHLLAIHKRLHESGPMPPCAL